MIPLVRNLSSEHSAILIVEHRQALVSEGILSDHGALGKLLRMLFESLLESKGASHLLETFEGDAGEGVLVSAKVSLGLGTSTDDKTHLETSVDVIRAKIELVVSRLIVSDGTLVGLSETSLLLFPGDGRVDGLGHGC